MAAMGGTRRTTFLAAMLALAAFPQQGAYAATTGDNAPPSLDLARGLVEAEQFEQAVAVLQRLDMDDSGSLAETELLFGRIYLAIGKPGKALEHFEKAQFSSLDVEAVADLGLAEAELALGDLGKARRSATNALRSDPDLVAAHLVLAKVDQRIGRADEALARLRTLQRDRPESEDAAVVFARYLAHQNGLAAGITAIEQFIALHPTAAGAQDALGQLLWASGRQADAVQARTLARRLYLDRGQTGRAEAMTAWLKALAPQDRVIEPKPTVTVPQRTAPGSVAPPVVVKPPQQDVRQTGQRQPQFQSPVPIRKFAPTLALPRPEPLPFPPGSAINTGSGIVLEGGRQILTNRHVVTDMRAIAVRNGTGHVRTARLTKVSDDDDLALLEIDQPFPEGGVMPLSDIVEPAPGRAAIVMGFPMIGLFGDEQPALTEGIVAKASGLGNDPTTFQMTAKINKGNSGGPIFDRRGRLIGITVAKVDVADILQKSGTHVEDINIGIKAGRILRFLGKAPTMADGPSVPEKDLEDLYQEMLPRAVLIAAQKGVAR